MTIVYFKCTLHTDVVINASLATEGNMQSLDFIPGSNFLGIVAAQLYKTIPASEALDIFHNEKVLFGDALLSKNGKVSYALPFSLFQDKLNDNIVKDDVWVHHGIGKYDKSIQLKQKRTGYFNKGNQFIKNPGKSFSLKSAYNANERRSAEGRMFGFDSIKKGQEFIFSVIFNDDSHIEKVTKALTGTKKIGKSKTAQYGQVEITQIAGKPDAFESKPTENNTLVIYAESRLCFLDENGNPTFQPEISAFGNIEGKIDWKSCQIRTNSFSPWNSKRNTPDRQRDFVERGSVFVIKNAKNIDISSLKATVGEYQHDGFGRVIYNPEFLKYDENGLWLYELNEIEKPKFDVATPVQINSVLGKILLAKSEEGKKDLSIGEKIIGIFKEEELNKKVLLDKKITKSQWGNIRTLATKAENIEKLKHALFNKETGYLMHGIAYEKIWGCNKEKKINALKNIIEQNADLGTQFVAKFASEIAKKNTSYE